MPDVFSPLEFFHLLQVDFHGDVLLFIRCGCVFRFSDCIDGSRSV